MAALSVVDGFSWKQSIGGMWKGKVRVLTGAGQAAEWIAAADIGMTHILGARVQVLGTATGVTTSVVLNARGTGVTEDVNRGDIGIETSGAALVEVEFEGRGNRHIKGRARNA